MDTVLLAVVLFMTGAAFGSFACCQAWRMHLGEIGKKKAASSRWSACMDCGYGLKWYDNVPIVSWLILRGKCRKCGKGIGWWELFAEVVLGVVFVVFGLWFAEHLGRGLAGGYGVEMIDMIRSWLVAGSVMAMLVGFAVLFISDARWGRLPVRYLTFCIICAIVFVVVCEWGVFTFGEWSVYTYERIWGYLGALAVLSVLYFLLYKLSGERWVGSGDWLLALPMALVLGDFWLAFFCLFAANLMGCLVVVPMMRSQKKNMKAQVPFGPFLIVAFMVVFLCQEWILGLV